MNKILSGWLVLVLALNALPLYARNNSQGNTVLADLIQEALTNDLRLRAAAQRTLAAEESVSQAGALPDPQLTFGLMNLPVNSFAFDQEPMTGKLISIMQVFPFPGKQALATDMAEDEAAAVRLQQAEIRNQIVNLVKRAYYDLYAIDRTSETVERNKALLEQLVRAAEVKYATGSGLQQDVLRAQVELSKLEDDLIMWQQKRSAATSKLNALLNRPADRPFEATPEELVLSLTPPSQFSPSQIEERRPLLRAWLERLGKAGAAVRLARRDRWPNFILGASYSQRDKLAAGTVMHDFFSATISLNIPLYSGRKQNAKVTEKKLEEAAAAAEYKNIRAEVLAEIESLRAELELHRKRVELYKGGILIQAQQSLESAQAGYQVGKVDFLTLINNWMLVQNYELQYFFALTDYHKALARYELATGGEVME